MISAEDLLKPISEEKPCGEDLSYDPAFQELDTIMKGKEETQFSAAEEPDWKLVRERCLELWPKSKDLRLATALALGLLKTEGLSAFCESLAIIKGLMENYWESCYPLLDPSDNNDPTQRVNIIAALAMPVGTYGDPMRFLERLQEAPLTNSMQMGRFSLADMVRGESGAAPAEGKLAPATTQVEAAFRDTSPEFLLALNETLTRGVELAKQIDEVLTKAVGRDKAPDLDLLPQQLSELRKRITPYLSGAAPAEAEATGAATGAVGAVAAGGGAPPISGEIQSRQDVVKMLKKICGFYRKTEPSSPVPYIIERAKRWVEMNFMELIDDLAPDSVKDIQRITGEKPKESE